MSLLTYQKITLHSKLSKQQCLEALNIRMMTMYFDDDYNEFDARGYNIGGLIFTDDTFAFKMLRLGKRGDINNSILKKDVPIANGQINDVAGGSEITVAFTTLKRNALVLLFFVVVGGVMGFVFIKNMMVTGKFDFSYLSFFITAITVTVVAVLFHVQYVAEARDELKRIFEASEN